MNRNTFFNIKSLLLIAVLGTALVTPSCAGMMQSWRQAHCNYDGAYQLGMNDGRAGKEMSSAIAVECPNQGKAAAMKGYREGYREGLTLGTTNAPAPQGTPAEPGQGTWQCKTAYGQKACGYSCVEAFGNLACAQEPHHNCVEAHGEVRCGQNCRVEYGQIKCD